MKKTISIFAAALLLFALALPAFADEHSSYAEASTAPQLTFFAYEHPARVVDEADILSEQEEAELIAYFDNLSEKHDFDIVAVTVDSIGYYYDISDFADNYYDSNGYGMGEENEGILMLLNMDPNDRGCWITAAGSFGTVAFDDYECDDLFNIVLPLLKNGEYCSAFNRFGELCDERINEIGRYADLSGYYDESEYYPDGFYYDDENYDYYYGNSGVDLNNAQKLLVSIAAGCLLAFIPVFVMKGKLKTVRRKKEASDYIVPGSMNIYNSYDRYLYSNVTKTPKPKQQNNNHGSSGGHSSGGFSGGGHIGGGHTGGGGRF